MESHCFPVGCASLRRFFSAQLLLLLCTCPSRRPITAKTLERRSPGTRLFSVGDREPDIYELFHQEALSFGAGSVAVDSSRSRPESGRRPTTNGELGGTTTGGRHSADSGSATRQASGAGSTVGGAFCAGQIATYEEQQVARRAGNVGGAAPRNGSAAGDHTPALDAADHQPGGELRGRLPEAALVAYITRNRIPPAQSPSLREAMRMAATIGGFLGCKGDGEPGTKTLWLGLRYLVAMTALWKILAR